MSYALPQEELVKLFSQSYLRHIASSLLIQQYKTFKESISQAVIVEKVKIQYGEIKSKKRDGYIKNKNEIEKISKQLPSNKVSIAK